MSKITLIRHGQASFGADNYDQLSDIGRQQAVALGEYFFNHQIKFDTIIHGQMSRQTETAQIIANTKKHPNELIQEKAANEFDSEHLIRYYLPKLADNSNEYHKIIHSEKEWFISGKNFEMIFRAMIILWQQDEHCPFESWQNFRKRVIELINKVHHQFGANKRIALVTSGGFISVIMQSILGLYEDKFVDLNLTINNASVSEINTRINHDIESVDTINANLLCFNNISPLVMKKQPHLITRK